MQRLLKQTKVTNRHNQVSYDEVAHQIKTLVNRWPKESGIEELLAQIGESYQVLARLILTAQAVEGGVKEEIVLRAKIRQASTSLIMAAIFSQVAWQKEPLPSKPAFLKMLEQMRRLFMEKNADYGNSFRFWGVCGLIVRIGDKYFRLKKLMEKGYRAKISQERLPDTALDLADYGMMLLMLLEEGRSLRFGE